jgi:tRNA (guanine-N7-)-methyltransferase
MSSDSAQRIASEAELVPVNCFAALDLTSIFGRTAPFEVDLGCGDGSFLAGLAAENAATDFLGIERLLGRVRAACRKIERGGLTNARVLRFEISYAVEHLLPPGSVTAFHLLFPDPWPKRRHASRRLVSEKFLAALHRALRPRGFVRVATDDLEYFRQIAQLAARSSLFTAAVNRAGSSPVTGFERRFRERGVAIHGLELRKIPPVT